MHSQTKDNLVVDFASAAKVALLSEQTLGANKG
jgi:hypothetical protein